MFTLNFDSVPSNRKTGAAATKSIERGCMVPPRGQQAVSLKPDRTEQISMRCQDHKTTALCTVHQGEFRVRWSLEVDFPVQVADQPDPVRASTDTDRFLVVRVPLPATCTRTCASAVRPK